MGDKLFAADCGESLVRARARAYGLQKQLAASLGMTDAALSRMLDGQLPVFLRLLDALGLEVIEKGEIEDLRRVLKRCL